MYNIHDLATQNTAYLLTCYDDCCNCIENACLRDFEEHLREKGELTIATFSGFAFQNVRNGEMHCTGRDKHELVLSSILQKRAYLNAYERFEDESQREAHFSKFNKERVLFDDTFHKGQKFKYLNFNNGQLGIPAFGDFTLAFPLNHFEDANLVFVKYNSLIRKEKGQIQCLYFTKNNEAIALETLTQDLATLEHFIPLIVVKRKEDLTNGTDVDYNLLILKPLGDTNSKHRDYIEVITWQEVKIKAGVRLRAEKERFQSIFDAVSDLDRIAEPMIKNLRELYELINTTLITTEYGN